MDPAILNLNKPTGMTSRQAVDCVKRLVRPAKCGHAGTLDPLASGVLVICVGSATRLIPYVQQMQKQYRASFLLGCSSPTDDTDGLITHLEGGSEPNADQVAAILPQFIGTIEQRPPAYSAVKVAGQRAYALARRGESVELAPRPVTIYRLTLLDYHFPQLELEIECGSGTYVRSLGRDLAAALGTGAVMSSLVRTAIGGFCVENAIIPDELQSETINNFLQPPLAAVASLPRVELTDEEVVEIHHGRPIVAAADCRNKQPEKFEAAAVDRGGRLVAIVRPKRAGQWWPVLNLH